MRTGLVLALGILLLHAPLASAQVAVPGAIAKPAAPPSAVACKSAGAALAVKPCATRKLEWTAIAGQPPGNNLANPAPAALPATPPLPLASAPTLLAPAADQKRVPLIWGSAEYLMWWTSAAPVPTPVVTAATNLADVTSGQLGSPNTSVLLGGQSYNTAMRAGGRFTLGTWLDPDARFGISGTYLFITPTTTFRPVSSNGNLAIGLPFFDVAGGAEGFAPLAVPDLRIGGASLAVTNRLQGGELNGSAGLLRRDGFILSALAGFRYLNFDEDLNFGFSAMDNAAAFLPGAHFTGFDRFNANNNFYGGQLGLRAVVNLGNWFVSATGKCAFGDVAQSASVSGGFATLAPTAPTPPISFIAPAGFYALPTNIGHHTHSAFAVVPEGTLNVGYNLGPRIRIFTGYNILYISNVERPGTAMQHAINSSVSPGFVGPGTTLVGPAVPSYTFTRSDFWAQGLNFGVQVRY